MKNKNYNLLGVLRSLCGESAEDVGFAVELSNEMRKQDATGNLAAREGFILPDSDLLKSLGIVERTATTLGTTDALGGGHNAVETTVQLGDLISSLSAKTSLGRAGVTMLQGLQGDIAIPKVEDDVTAAWFDNEAGNATQDCPVLGQVGMKPHTLGAYVDISRKLLIQTSSWAETLVIGLLRDALARALETAVFAGTGENGEPLGILGNAGIQTVDLVPGAVTRNNLLDFIEKLETANVDVSSGCAWIGSPAVKKLLAQTVDLTAVKNMAGTENVGGVATKYLYANGKAEDFDFITSGLCPSKKLFFGKWSDVVVGVWRGVSLLVDKYTLARSGACRVVVLGDFDVALRHPESIAFGNAIADAAGGDAAGGDAAGGDAAGGDAAGGDAAGGDA